MDDAKEWAAEQFATLDLGHAQREYRGVRMLRRAAERPAGRLTEVFLDDAERQAAYDFVESGVAPAALARALGDATMRLAASAPYAFVVVDGTSLTLTDRGKKKDFGSIGRRSLPTRGLKVIDALAVDASGVPLGLLDMQWWARKPRPLASRFVRRRKRHTETRHWVDVVERVQERTASSGVQPWFVIDREGDCGEILRAVAGATGASFTVRAAQDRRLFDHTGRSLRAHMQRRRIVGRRVVRVPGRDGRPARLAQLDVRVGAVVLDLPDYAAGSRARTPLAVHVVWARERHGPKRQQRLDWMLLTNKAVDSFIDATAILDSYCYRWRIEDFHRTWKSGRCCVEDTQLRQRDHVVRWATMLAAVAARVERLKHLARTEPDAPATVGFSPIELQALRVLHTQIRRRNEVLPDGVPTMATALVWLAQQGGYVVWSKKPPGSITIGRGLERLTPFALGVQAGLKLAKK